ncbi:MAG: nucleotidyltransferase family protein [Hyphomicrobiales bacterium]
MSGKNNHGHTAMVLAAGFGTRMRPLTLTVPKPLIAVAGQPLIAHGFDRLREAHVAKAVVNGHYLAEQIFAWCAQQRVPHTVISDERDAILDTGGGIARALPLLGNEPFFVLNSDSFWIDDGLPALERLRAAWRDDAMDCLLLLCDPAQTTGYDGHGDFAIADNGTLSRAKAAPGRKAYAYIGGYLVHPRLFAGAPAGAFSMNVLWDRAIAQGRLSGLAHDGHWLHVGTPEAIAEAEAWLGQKA